MVYSVTGIGAARDDTHPACVCPTLFCLWQRSSERGQEECKQGDEDGCELIHCEEIQGLDTCRLMGVWGEREVDSTPGERGIFTRPLYAKRLPGGKHMPFEIIGLRCKSNKPFGHKLRDGRTDTPSRARGSWEGRVRL